MKTVAHLACGRNLSIVPQRKRRGTQANLTQGEK
jgi:hypothetical protein